MKWCFVSFLLQHLFYFIAHETTSKHVIAAYYSFIDPYLRNNFAVSWSGIEPATASRQSGFSTAPPCFCLSKTVAKLFNYLTSSNHHHQQQQQQQQHHHQTTMRLRLSVCQSIWGKNQLRDENGRSTCTIKYGSWWGCCRGFSFGCEGKGKGQTRKHDFRRAARHTFIVSRTFARGRYSL